VSASAIPYLKIIYPHIGPPTTPAQRPPQSKLGAAVSFFEYCGALATSGDARGCSIDDDYLWALSRLSPSSCALVISKPSLSGRRWRMEDELRPLIKASLINSSRCWLAVKTEKVQSLARFLGTCKSSEIDSPAACRRLTSKCRA